MKTLIKLTHANVSYGQHKALQNITWQLEQGQNWAILGANGAGKSTFLRLVRGELWPDQTRDATNARAYYLTGQKQASPIGLRQTIGLVSAQLQERYTKFEWNIDATSVVLSGFYDAPLLYQAPTPEQKQRAHELFALLRCESLSTRSMLTLSQGEARKVLIARAMAPLKKGPCLLILDEVCEGLDTASRESLLETIDHVVNASNHNVHLLHTTHRSEELPACVTHALLLSEGKIHSQGPKQHTLTQKNIEAVFKTNVSATSCPIPQKNQDAQNAAPTSPLIEIANAYVYLDRQLVLKNINWKLRINENWAVLGANGAGKSTFVKLIQADVHPAFDKEYPAITKRFGLNEDAGLEAIKHHIGYVSAQLQAQYTYECTGLELVCSGFFSGIGTHRGVTSKQEEKARHWMAYFGLESFITRNVQTLSTGQMRRLLLARAMVTSDSVQGPFLLLLDEPCSGLDMTARDHFLQTLRRLAQSGVQLIYVTHYEEELIPEITHVLTLKNGHVHEQISR